MCVTQKEHPTTHHLDRSRRQHWDVAVIKTPIEVPTCNQSYDHLRLGAVIEFGMNVGRDHLIDDISRLSDRRANLDFPLIAHFYRFSEAANRFSRRDWSPKAMSLCRAETIQDMLRPSSPVIVYDGVADTTKPTLTGLLKVTADAIVKLVPEGHV